MWWAYFKFRFYRWRSIIPFYRSETEVYFLASNSTGRCSRPALCPISSFAAVQTEYSVGSRAGPEGEVGDITLLNSLFFNHYFVFIIFFSLPFSPFIPSPHPPATTTLLCFWRYIYIFFNKYKIYIFGIYMYIYSTSCLFFFFTTIQVWNLAM